MAAPRALPLRESSDSSTAAMRIAVVGTGYVGLVTATCLAESGNDIVGIDKDARKIQVLESGRLPIHEPGLLELPTLVSRMTAGGQPFGIGVPSLKPGSPADVCLIDLDAEWEVGEAGYESRSSNNAFAGQRLTGRVRMTVADGTVAYRERSFAIGAV